MTSGTLAGKTILVSGAAREEDPDLDFFLPDAPLPARV